MTPTTPQARRRTRRLLPAGLAALLALGGGFALAVAGTSQPANAAPGDVFFTTPEYTLVTHSPFQFDGEASPGDAITITSAHGPDCTAVADAGGIWTCNVVFTSSVDVTVITVSRDVDDGNPATQESDGQEHHISLPLVIDETTPGNVRSNASPPALTGTGAFPGADVVGTIGAQPCTGVADGAGNWTCTSPPQGDGVYPSGVQQDVLGGGLGYSDVSNTLYTSDTTGPPWPETTVPYDSTLGPANTQTSDRTPTIGGGIGTAEPFTTVFVALENRGGTPIVHPGAPPAITPYCNDVAAADGSWSCTGAPLTIGDFHQVSLTGMDDFGNPTVGSPDDDFGIEILPPPAAPVVTTPLPVAGELSPFPTEGTVDAATTAVEISEGGTVLCGPVAPVALAFSCNLALTPGVHTVDVIAYDVYETPSAPTTLTLDAWAPPNIMSPIPGTTTSASTVDIVGSVPEGADVQVRVDGAGPPLGCAFVAANPTYSCTTGFLAVGGHTIEVDYLDPNGDPSATVNSNVTIVPTLPAPGFTAPASGLSTTDRTVEVSTTNAALGTMFVREGLQNLCAPAPVAVATYSCTTVPLSVGTHTITVSQRDQYGVMGASAQRTITILPSPVPKPLAMKTFGFSIQVLGEDGAPIGEEGVGTGDLVTIVASNVPPGTQIEAEIHSDPVALGGMTVGPTGQLLMRSVVPAVPPGDHDIVVAATAPGYWPGTATSALTVHGLKQMSDNLPQDEVKELGTPEDVKELGTPLDGADGSGGGAGGPGGVGGGGWGDPSVFGTTVENPLDPQATAFSLSPAGIILSGSIAIAFLLLVGFPAELLESTIRSNYDRAFGWLARLRSRVQRMLAPVGRLLSRPWVGTAITVTAAAFILGFADPDYGFTGASVRLFLAMILAVAAINIGLSLIVMRVAHRAFDVTAVLKPMPAALVIVALSVLVSRAMGISPGFLFGVVLGVAYARELKLRDDARLGVLGVVLTIAAGLLAWLGYGIASATISGEGFVNNLVIEVLAAITLEALGTLLVALLPIEFLDGRTIFRWSKLAWAGLFAVTALVFLFVVVPLSDNWGTMSTPMFGWGTLFAVFAVLSVAVWALFRRRPVSASSPAGAGPRRRARR